ncbi:MAG: molybdenum cofactor biosynthesis protein B [Rhodobacteraceae bacterium]|nr:MAG: molybdenum cofactor biosynthesis protein B [Paracoccaceae bacterium]
MVDTRRFIPINIAVLTVSDTRTLDDDKSGDLLEKRIKKSGHVLTSRLIIPDEKDQIVKVLENWISEKDVDVIISTGGTGLTGRDVTIEAHKLLYDKEITAFQTVFSIISMHKIGTSAIQSRACAGVASGTYLFALPGSPSACRDAWDEILVLQFDYRHLPCNFVELIPRLEEFGRGK